MDYMRAMAFLEETKKYGSVLGLRSIRTLMEYLGNVQDRIPTVHIGGTNGKGSVGAMLSSVLAEAGYRVGRFNTPDVFSYEEEFLMNGKPIEKERLAEIFTKVAEACRQMAAGGNPHPTRFEVETAAAFLWFYEEKCDVALVEVGMGGETDATNVISEPLLCILTSISMDHMKFLGNCLSDIASVKSGIIKEGCPVVTVRQQKEAQNVIENRSREKRAVCICADVKENVRDVKARSDGRVSFEWRYSRRNLETQASEAEQADGKEGRLSEFEMQTEGWRRMTTGLCGMFQVENTLCALEALRVLQKTFPDICEEHIRKGIARTVWRGRFEKIGGRPDFYLDGAHNEGAVKMLRETLDTVFAGRKIIYIMGVLADKEYERMIRTMFCPEDIVFTVTPENPRALDGRMLADKLQKQKIQAVYCENIRDAVLCSLQRADAGDIVLAFGSLSYLREVRTAYETLQK